MTYDFLRFEFISQSSELIASYSVSLAEAARRGNPQAARVYFDCIRAVARDLNKTLQEVENEEAGRKARVEANAGHSDERNGAKARGNNDAVRRDHQQRSGLADGARGHARGQAAASRV